MTDLTRADEEPVFVEPRWPIVARGVGVHRHHGYGARPRARARVAGSDLACPGNRDGPARRPDCGRPSACDRARHLAAPALDRARRLARGRSHLVDSGPHLRSDQRSKRCGIGRPAPHSGALVWLGNCLAFALLYWLLDSGGPLARYRGEREFPDFAFSQQLSPELAPPGWRPQFADYLVLGLTTNMAFSPTDVMPMVLWAKLTMGLQSLISLIVFGLVIARAVNVFS
jgi:hypothetical protein